MCNISFPPPQIGHRGAALAIEIDQLEGVGVGQGKSTDADAGKGMNLSATGAAQAGYRNPGVA